jgi:hypothetical protein
MNTMNSDEPRPRRKVAKITLSLRIAPALRDRMMAVIDPSENVSQFGEDALEAWVSRRERAKATSTRELTS